jgi:hypothetical protein
MLTNVEKQVARGLGLSERDFERQKDAISLHTSDDAALDKLETVREVFSFADQPDSPAFLSAAKAARDALDDLISDGGTRVNDVVDEEGNGTAMVRLLRDSNGNPLARVPIRTK